MEATINTVRHNPLLERTEFVLDVEHEGEPTPSKESLLGRFTAEQDFDPEKVEVIGVETPFGQDSARARLYVHGEVDLDSYEEELEEEPVEAGGSGAEGSADVDYEDLVDNTISDAKSELESIDSPDYNAVIEAEKQNKNRKTFLEWLESQ